MKVFVLVFSVGLYSGHKDLIGIYDDYDKAKEALNKDMEQSYCSRNHYSIHEIELNEEVNITFAEW